MTEANFASINELPTEELTVSAKTTAQTRIGSQEFVDEVQKELKGGKMWRSSRGLSTALKVDAVDLNAWLRNQVGIVSKPSKEEGIFLYALSSRIESALAEEKPTRHLVNEEDRYALAISGAALKMLDGLLRKYAVAINDRSSEAFGSIVSAKSKLEAGVLLLATAHKADLEKLP